MGLETFPGPFPKIPIFVTRGPAERCPTRRSRRCSGRCQTPRYPPPRCPGHLPPASARCLARPL